MTLSDAIYKDAVWVAENRVRLWSVYSSEK